MSTASQPGSFDANPYASPQAYSPTTDTAATPSPYNGLWRDGSQLVMHKAAVLPDRCVKSNEPASGKLKRKLNWHPGWVFVLLLVSPLIYIIVALILTKRATILIGLSERWFSKRRTAIFVGWSMVLAGIGLFVYAIASIEPGPGGNITPLLVIAGILLFLVGAIYGLIAARMVAPTKITDEHIWLKGVCPEFLVQLPPLPGAYTPPYAPAAYPPQYPSQTGPSQPLGPQQPL